jgi:hypothetical protein
VCDGGHALVEWGGKGEGVRRKENGSSRVVLLVRLIG